MGINAQIRSFRDRLFKEVNDEQLPLEVKRLVLAEISAAVNQACDVAIKQELEEKETDNG